MTTSSVSVPVFARQVLRGLLPLAVGAACIAAAFVLEPVGLFIGLAGLLLFGGMSAAAIVSAPTLPEAVTAAFVAAALAVAGIVNGAWLTMPFYWFAILAAGCSQLLARFAAGVSTARMIVYSVCMIVVLCIVAAATLFSGVLICGGLTLLAIAAFMFARVRLGPPPE